MSREEAIKAIKTHCYFANLVPAGKEALDMAIKALEREPCCKCIEFKRYAKEMGFEIEQEPCGDTISRAAAIRVASGYCHPANIAKELAKLPPAQPKLTEHEDCVNRKDIYFKLTNGAYPGETIEQFTDRLVKELNTLPPVTPKPKTECSCDQIKWERDMAIAQLNELGYGLGEKPKVGHWIDLENTRKYRMFKILSLLWQRN